MKIYLDVTMIEEHVNIKYQLSILIVDMTDNNIDRVFCNDNTMKHNNQNRINDTIIMTNDLL